MEESLQGASKTNFRLPIFVKMFRQHSAEI